MDMLNSLNPALTQPVLTGNPVPKKDATQAQKEQFAKDFESVFIEKLLDEMKNTIGTWGFEQDGAAKQIQGLFWMNLARDVSKNGGMGMWKEIYQSLNQESGSSEFSNVLNDKL